MSERPKSVVWLLAVVVSAFGLYFYVSGVNPDEESDLDRLVNVVKARENLKPGAMVSEANTFTSPVPIRYLGPHNLLAQNLTEFVDKPLSSTVEEGAMIMETDFKPCAESKSVPLDFAVRVLKGETLEADEIAEATGLSSEAISSAAK